MLYILNKQEQIIATLSNKGNMNKVVPYFEDIHIEELDTGVETFEFKTISNSSAANSLQIGNYVAFKDKEFYKIFQIKEVKEIHAEQVEKTVYCEGACLELLNEIVRPMEINSANLRQFLNTILDGTSWSIGLLDAGINEVIPVSLSDYDNVYKIIQDVVIGEFGGEIRFRVEIANNRIIGKYIDVFARRGRVTKHRFEYGVNMTSVEKTVDSSELVTALIGIGKDDITFKEVESDDKPKNQDFIISEDAYNRWNNKGSHIMGVFNCESESPQELLRLTRDELKRRSEPKITYDLEVELLGEDVNLGDEVFVIDNEFNPPLYLSARVSKLEISKTDSQSNRCTLANFKEVKSSITSEMRALASGLEGKVDDKINKRFPVDSQDIKDGAITEGKIESQYLSTIMSDIVVAGLVETEKLIANKAEISDLQATNATIEDLKVNKADITDLQATNATIENLKADKADVDSLKSVVANVETLYTDKANVTDLNALNATVTNLKADKANITDLQATNANIENLKANKADIDSLNALEIKTNTIDASKATISDLNATNANISNLQASKADIAELNAVKGNVEHLTSEVADINTLVNGNLTSDNIHSLVLTSDKVTVEDAFIKNAMIDEIDANKLRAGEINTGLVTIASPSGGITIANNTQQFKDKNNKVRVQIGEDKSGDFNFSIYDETGTGVLIDHTGVKEGALADDIIKSDMIESDAVGEKQINYNSFATGFNKDTNTNTLKATKVRLDNSNQTLEVGFNQLKTQSDDTKSKTESNSTKLEVQQGQIQGLISDTTIEKDGESIKIKDAYSEMEQTVNSFGVTIGEHTSQITEIDGKADNALTKATSVESTANNISGKVTQVESAQSSLKQDLDGFKTTVSKDYSTKAELNATNEKLGTVEGTVSSTSSKVSTLESNLEGITQRVSSTESTTATLTTNVGKVQETANTANTNATNANSKIDNLQIGGRNLVKNSAPTTVGWNHWSNPNTLTTTEKIIDEPTSLSRKAMEITIGGTGTGAVGRHMNPVVKPTGGKKYSWSVYLKASRPLKASIGMELGLVKNVNVTTEWQKFEHTAASTDGQYYAFVVRIIENGTAGDKLYFHSAMFVEGDKVPTWTPSPEDVDSEIKEVNAEVTKTNQKVSSIEMNLDGITSRVELVESTTLEIDEKVDAYETRLSYAEQQIDKDAIITTVSSTIDQKVNAGIGSIKISKNNLINNSTFENDKYWTLDSNKGYIDKEKTFGDVNTLRIIKSGVDTSTYGGARQTILEDVKTGEEFVVSGYYLIENKSLLNGKFACELKGEYEGGSGALGSYFSINSTQATQGVWTKFSYKIKTTRDYNKVFIYPWVEKSGEVWFSKLQVVRGTVDVDWDISSQDIEDKISISEINLNSNIDTAISDVQDNILLNVADNYATSDSFTQLSETVSSNLKQTNEDIKMNFDKSVEYTKEVDGKLEEYQNTVGTHIRFSEDGIDLGKTNSPFTATLDNEKLAFKQDDQEVAYISNNKMHITNAEVKDVLRVGTDSKGYFSWVQGEKGNLSLKWSDK